MVALCEVFESLPPLEHPRVDKSTRARERNSGALELGGILKADFTKALEVLARGPGEPANRRALVRCFGSLIDGLANAFLTIADVVRQSQGHRPDPVRQEEPEDLSTSVLLRIGSSYRILCRYLPKSPLTRLSGTRRDDLKACVEIRNRVVHPDTPADLEVTDSNLRLITEVARRFIGDFATFARWQAERQPTPGGECLSSGCRKRHRGGRRFRKCPCGSDRKYKNCCAAAPRAA